jgi:hypothetical protein
VIFCLQLPHSTLTINNYNTSRQNIIDNPSQIKVPLDHGNTIFVHFTYCATMRPFPEKFHTLWNKYFRYSPINKVIPVLGTRNVNNLQRQLMHTRHLSIIVTLRIIKQTYRSLVIYST